MRNLSERLRFGTMSAEGVLMKVVKVSTVDGLVLLLASLGSIRAHVYDFLTVACFTILLLIGNHNM